LTLEVLYKISNQLDDLLLPYTIDLSFSMRSAMPMSWSISDAWESRFMRKRISSGQK